MNRSLRPTWIPFGWFICAAITSLVLMVLIALGVVGDQPAGGDVSVAAALAIGFWAGGFLVGTRVAAAPFLHGIGIGLFSLVVWVGVNLFLGEPTDQTAWRSLDAVTAVGLLLVHTVAVIVGLRMGIRWVLHRA